MVRDLLTQELSQLAERYQHSTIALEIFVREALRGIDNYTVEYAKAQEALDSIREGQGPPQTETPSDMAVGLSEEHLRITSLAVEFYSSFFTSHRQMLLEMSLVYAGALFDAVISDALMTVLRRIPERLRSSRTLTAAEALRFDSRDELIEELARRELGEVMYKSVEKQFEYFRTSFGADAFGGVGLSFSIVDLSAVRERRNLIAHNGGLATPEYVERFDAGVTSGERVVSDPERTESDRKMLSAVGLALLARLGEELN